jgi:tetratricopeptide (TPR) repeat protein
MRKFLFLLLSFAFIAGCTGEKNNSATGGGFVTAKVVPVLLEEQYIFNADTAMARSLRVSKDQLIKAKQLFMKGLDFYINQKNGAESAKLFRESILYNPDYQTYTYLGNAYIDMGDTLRADSALTDYEMPDAERLYAKARLYAIKKDPASAISTLTDAFAYGFFNRKRLENDKVFGKLRSEPGYESIVVTYLKDDAKLQAAFFKRFLDSAPNIPLPYSFEKDSIKATQAGIGIAQAIDYNFAAFVPGMEDSRFSRDVSNSYYMVGKLKLDNGNFAVIYKSVMVIVDTLPSVDVNIAVYDSLGNVGEVRALARFELPESLSTGTIDENKVIITKDFKIKWKTDPLENGYAGNEYMGEDLVSENKFVISADRKFVPYSAGNEKNSVAKQ